MTDTRDRLLAKCGTRRFHDVPIGDDVIRIRSITAREYSRVEAKLTRAVMSGRGGKQAKQEQGMAEANALLIQLCVCDGDGNLVFTESDLDRLQDLDNSVGQAIVAACMDHSGIDSAELETLAKNSAETNCESSSTA